MRVLLLSDIHANLEALNACLNAASPYDAVANLGDVVGYGGNPNEVIERSQQLGELLVRGNHDKACSGISSIEGFNPVAAMAALWTRDVLSKKNMEWLRALPQGPMLLPGLENAAFVHGSPVDEDEYLLGPEVAEVSLQRARARVTFFGHTHLQGGFGLDQGKVVGHWPAYQSRDQIASHEIRLNPAAHYLINPGSVGQPRDRDWRAAFAIFDSDANTVKYFRVPYDVKQAQKKILDADLPEQLAARLALGR